MDDSSLFLNVCCIGGQDWFMGQDSECTQRWQREVCGSTGPQALPQGKFSMLKEESVEINKCMPNLAACEP